MLKQSFKRCGPSSPSPRAPEEEATSTFRSLGLPIALGAKGCRRSQAGDTTNPARDRILTLQSSPKSFIPSDWMTVPLKPP